MTETGISLLPEKNQKRTTERELAPASSADFLQKEKQELLAGTIHPAIQAWRRALERYPRKPTWSLIIDTIGPEPNETALKSAVEAWHAEGFNPDNVRGILDWYQARLGKRSPGQNKNNNNGYPPVGLVPTVPTVGGNF